MKDHSICTAGGYARIVLKQLKFERVSCRDCLVQPYGSYSGFEKHSKRTGHNIIPKEIVRKNVYHGLCIHNEHSFLVIR